MIENANRSINDYKIIYTDLYINFDSNEEKIFKEKIYEIDLTPLI